MKYLQDIANILRRDIISSTTIAGSGHPSSCLSCAEIISVLFFKEMSIDIKNPFNQKNDEFILSKGHASPILYSALFRAKLIDHHPLSLRKIKSPLEGHPIPSQHVPWIKVATGSLGQGLSIGAGMALASKINKINNKIYVLTGDGEFVEGSNFEALQLASHYNLNNLVLIIDVNRLAQTGETMLGYNLKAYAERLISFGWNPIIINGHKIKQIIKAIKKARYSSRPTAIIARTIKGKGVSFLENKNNLHGKTLSPQEMREALKEIPEIEFPKAQIKSPGKHENNKQKLSISHYTSYSINEEIATREAYGNALVNLAKSNKNIIAIDGDVSNSTYSNKLKEHFPHNFIEAYIAEQNMLGMALGLSKKDFNIFASTFAAFLTRAHDQLRMTALSSPNLTICGSHAGVSIGEDGASQMGLEDIAMFRSLPNSIILYPSDAVSTEKLVYLAAKTKGLKYIRTTRPKTKVLYKNSEKFSIGDFKILKSSKKDVAVLIGAGITLHESLKAHYQLKEKGIKTSVIDLYCIKPLNIKKLANFIKEHGNKLVITEDHYKEGSIGEMLKSELSNKDIEIKHLCINEIPHSGPSEELLDKYKISARYIARAIS